MSVKSPKSIMLIINTEQYAGNFERAMCAYVTGQTDEYGSDEEIAKLASPNIKHLDWWEQHIVQESDSGSYRPVTNWATNGWFNNGMGGIYKEGTPEALNAGNDSAESLRKYHEDKINNLTTRLANEDFDTDPKGWTKKNCEANLKNINDSIEKARNDLTKHPAYLSVAIFVDALPPSEVWEEFVQRSQDFAQNRDKIENEGSDYHFAKESLTITGFEQLEPKLKIKKTVKIK